MKPLSSFLDQVGIRPGDFLIVHGSFKSLGVHNASPWEVVHSLVQFLGPDGTLMMPTFSFSYAGIWEAEAFDPANTPSARMGVLAETLREFPGSMRSAHPTHSVAAHGKHANRVTRDKSRASALGRNSSFEDALALDAKILLMGVGQDRNSMLHYAEVAAEIPYNDIPCLSFWGAKALLKENGYVVEIPQYDFPGCSRNFNIISTAAEVQEQVMQGNIFQSPCMVMRAQAIIPEIIERLRREPTWLLCHDKSCECCTLRKRRMKEVMRRDS